jgi:two-component system cell cycle sensor histidine kinase/response regulator CckA
LGDREGNIIDANETACALTGDTRDELVALDVRILFTPDSLAAKPLRFDLVDGGMNVINERILQRKDGGHVPIEMRSKRLSDNTLQSIIRDISERRRLEEQLQLRQRMDSLGTLAGGIAHDFNNILTAILGYADILRLSRPELAVEQRENVEQVLAAARRAGDLVRSLQSLSRPGPAQVATFDLHQVAAEIVHVLEETTDRLIVKELRFPPNLHLVKGDASAVYHALMNLGINAVQAVEDKGQGHDGRVIFDAEPYHAVTDGRRSLADGAYVHLTVRDTGAGMTEEVRQRVFEPLFTTKAKGERKGQGLGLAMVYNIVVRQHGGYVEVESSPGAGSTFHLYLPAGVAEPTVREVQAAPPRGGDESILVVEDEDQLLALTCTTLEGLGYRVLAARDGREALRVFQDHSDGIDLVVLDRTLPMLPGERVLREMQAVRADVKVLVSSGDASLDLASFPGACGLLSKPYELHRLCELIRQVLDGTTVSP